MYPDDHAPPHFHVQTPDGESLVQIEGLAVLGTGAETKALKAACFGQKLISLMLSGHGMSKTGGTDI
ncbi:DUF4160 domain-containing protein [Pseudomonas paralactis]|uniref:DUF4160 domain-containing protein n=1 Tax=Pseudomonas paralactis TaxID=1615673 RepID=UPI003B8A8D9D